MPSPDAAVASRVAWGILLACVATIGAAWILQASGYTPCELCLQERVPYYVGALIAALTGVAGLGRRWRVAAFGMALLLCCFAVGTVLGAYHTGVEWGFWAGPSACSGQVQAAADVRDFLQQLDRVQVVRCDQPALVVLGLTLAAWNTLISMVLAGLAAWGVVVLALRRPQRR